MAATDDLDSEPTLSLYWAPVFADDAQPSAQRVVDARWDQVEAIQGDVALDQVVIETTTVYTVTDDAPIVAQQQFVLGTQRAAEPVGAFQWRVESNLGGHDACRFYADAVIAPADSPDLDALRKLVDHVVKKEAIKQGPDTDVPAERKKACSPGA